MAVAGAVAGSGAAAAAQARVEAMFRDHGATLRWIARRWTGTADEAEDALQRALEIYLRRLDSVDPETELAWLKVVVRHEAMALRRRPPSRASRSMRPTWPSASRHRTSRSRSAWSARSGSPVPARVLAQLKPDERTALMLKAEGYSFPLRSTARSPRGAAASSRRSPASRRGEECERLAPTLLALVQGEAASDDLLALRPHLRGVPGDRPRAPRVPPPPPRAAPCRSWRASRRRGGSADRVTDGSPRARRRPQGSRSCRRSTASPAPDAARAVAAARRPGAAVAGLPSRRCSASASAAAQGRTASPPAGLPDPVRLVQRSERPEPRREQPPRRRTEQATPTPPTTTPAVPSATA